MTESVDILIKADDQASAKLEDVSNTLDKSMKQVAGILRSLETPTDKYNRQLEELAEFHKQGAISAEEFAKAEEKLTAKIKAAADSVQASGAKLKETADATKSAIDGFKDTGQTTKQVSEFAGVLATLTGNSEVASFAGQMASATEKVSQFSEVSKAGKAGALAFKLGLVALVAGAGALVGKWLGDMIFGTKKFERQLEATKEEAKRLDDQIKRLAQTRMSEAQQDIELIRDPEEKRKAYKQLLGDLQRDIATAAAVANKSKRDAEEWAEAWQITGDRKQYAEDAKAQAEADQERLDALKEQMQVINRIAGARAEANEQLRAENAAKDRSEGYLETLRQEVEYLKATREEQIKLDAARNTTEEDRGEAERLLKERDAILAKAEAERELEAARVKAEEEAAKAAIKAAEDIEKARQKAEDDRLKAAEKLREEAAREAQRIEDIKNSERERLELQRIELEQGKEAAKVQELINKGIDEATAKQLAAEQTALEKLKQKQLDEQNAAKEDGKPSSGPGAKPTLTAVQGRLLTRGPSDRQERWLEQSAKSLATIATLSHTTAEAAEIANDELAEITNNTSNTLQIVATV